MTPKRFFAGLLLCATALPLSAEPIEFLVAYENTEQPPYHLGNTSETPELRPGVSVEMIRSLSRFIPELQVRFRRVPWNRCLREMEAGKVDAVFNASFKPERLKLGAYPWKDGQPDVSRRIATLSYSLYTLKSSNLSWDGERVLNLRGNIGTPSGYSIVDDLKKKRLPVEEAQTTRTNLLKLLHGRVAAVAAQDVTADKLLRDEASLFRDVVKLTPPLVSKPYYMMISHQFIHDHPLMAERIWDTLAQMRDEMMPALFEKYAQ